MKLETNAVKLVKGFLDRESCKRLIDSHKQSDKFELEIEGEKKYRYSNPEESDFLMGIELMLKNELYKYIEENKINNFGNFKAGDFKLMDYYEDSWLVEHYDGDFSKWPEGGYKYHPMTVDIALNDWTEYEGGELFMCGQRLKMNAGDMIIFPSSFSHPHGVKKVTKGNRYVLISEPYALEWGLQDTMTNVEQRKTWGQKLLSLLK